MCGIFGKITTGAPLDPHFCRRQTDTLAHRGPDGAGYFWANSRTGEFCLHSLASSAGPTSQNGWDIFLGHRRLAVLDLFPRAAQPMSDPNGRYWLVFNGEIYNFADLRRELGAFGAIFATDHSDTEALLWAYIRWGEECLSRLRGMFAFAVLDFKEQTLFLARDRVGKKPLYYRAHPGGLTFASELKAILADPETPRDLNPAALAQYLAYGYIPAPNTIYQGIAKLPAAHCVKISLKNPQNFSLRRYWRLPEPDPSPPERNWSEEFLTELTEAVRLRLISDVPLGAFASGGSTPPSSFASCAKSARGRCAPLPSASRLPRATNCPVPVWPPGAMIASTMRKSSALTLWRCCLAWCRILTSLSEIPRPSPPWWYLRRPGAMSPWP